jgi:hypothetical protein
MAHLIRSPKSASDWADSELRAYRISVKEQDAVSFFGTGELPEPNCPRDFLDHRVATEDVDQVTNELLWGMEEIVELSQTGEASVDQFARSLLLATGFTNRHILPSVRRPLRLLIGGEGRSAQTDVCLVYNHCVLLLVQEDKAPGRPADCGEAQLIAEAVAVWQYNVRSGTLGEDATEVVPAVLMVGTYPVFYKIPVSALLNASIESLSYPAVETVVARCSPKVPRFENRYGEGMYSLDHRAVILRHLEAFRRYVFVPCSEAMLGTQLGLPP